VIERPDRFRHLGVNAARKIARSFSTERAVDGYAAIVSEAVATHHGRAGGSRIARARKQVHA